MSLQDPQPDPIPSGTLGWLTKVNSEVSQWAASMSWWRLFVLFVVIMIASSILGELLHLKHDRVRAGPNKELAVTIGGRNGIHITTIPKTPPNASAPPVTPVPGESAEAAADAAEKAAERTADAAEQAVERAVETAAERGVSVRGTGTDFDDDMRRVVTVPGLLGDFGGAVLVVLFAYLVGSKIVVRKVAQADAKVRTAVDAAEREAMERQLVQARLQVLQAQVEPHFLFNTLAAVDYLIETEPPRASQMQKALITYLRGALPQMREGSSTLGREMRLIRSYLDLIKMRIEDRLQVEIAVPAALEAAEFPPMMLQSLVENAVKHGIEPKTEGGRIRVAAGTTNGTLWVEVSDTGVGMPEGDMVDAPTSGTGIGLHNIGERLSMLYPGKSRLVLRSDAGAGTVVKISVPLRIPAPAGAAQPADVPQGKPA